jgi:hypothetical protein
MGGEAVLRGDVVGARKVHAVSLLGSPAELSSNQQADGLHINRPAETPGKYAFVLRISFEDSKHERNADLRNQI